MTWRASMLFVGLFVATGVIADAYSRDESDPDTPKWSEETVAPPDFPQDVDLREFYVSELTSHKFFVDASTLNPGKDNVVRYVLVVRTGGGATNVSFEGIRCDSREYKIYATGRSGGAWVKAYRSEWRPIENKPVNRHHIALSRDLLCPNGLSIRTLAEGQEALRLGRHPQVQVYTP